ncbi:hypothetical protein DENIS_4013 [Desulfonema ishimotonii]|uniref:Uncharacterized protein n=1 Tax=Desulfonema ishimotonii TaxID=45657 RepID=A0A401G1D7_9BACT|nr:hypothetical protein DENIS_4013 [Desulfonema ishimotonii]
MLHGILSRPEPGAVKVARPVLRGLGDGDIPRLPGDAKGSGEIVDMRPSLRVFQIQRFSQGFIPVL